MDGLNSRLEIAKGRAGECKQRSIKKEKDWNNNNIKKKTKNKNKQNPNNKKKHPTAQWPVGKYQVV